MAGLVVIGSQWGDEGKGKITDFLARKAKMVVRYQGGNNAGHTVVADGVTYKLHIIPSGILYPDKICVIGNGMVIDPAALVEEIEYIESHGYSVENLRISGSAHLIMPYHRKLDALEEDERGANKIGTTRRGIGPAYRDKAARVGIRMNELFDKEEFTAHVALNLKEKNKILEKVYDAEGFTTEEIVESYMALAEKLKKYITDTSLIINEALSRGEDVLFEGAQGTLLDIEHGTYPYVTSSHPVSGGVCIGAGVGPTKIDHVMGVVKAYTTRVGEGPFPTELNDETGEFIRQQGYEFGTTTGRPRRCGWLDAVIGRYAVRISGIDSIAVTKLDVLTGLETLKICTAYEMNGEIVREFPTHLATLAKCKPIYEELPGWTEDITGAARLEDLPVNARRYLERIGEILGVPLSIVAVGPGREQTIVLHEQFTRRK